MFQELRNLVLSKQGDLIGQQCIAIYIYDINSQVCVSRVTCQGENMQKITEFLFSEKPFLKKTKTPKYFSHFLGCKSGTLHSPA